MIDFNKIIQGDIRTLSKAITLVESTKLEDIKEADKLLQKIYPLTGKSKRIAVTGSPGAGKSTFIESLALEHLKDPKEKIAVLAIDPSSPLRGGSILGDKTRMEELSNNTNAFIRLSPSKGTLGGITRSTYKAMLLCEAAGYTSVVIETVGVGQSELDVYHFVDLVMLILQPGAGDELQSIKKGIVEVSDFIIVNKADGDQKKLAEQTAQDFNISKPIFVCSSLVTTKSNIDTVRAAIVEYFTNEKNLKQKRNDQMNTILKDLLKHKISAFLETNSVAIDSQVKKIISQKSDPFIASNEIMKELIKTIKN